MKNWIKTFWSKEPKTNDRFSDFFLHAPADVKEEVLTEAARHANKEQMEVFTQARRLREAQ